MSGAPETVSSPSTIRSENSGSDDFGHLLAVGLGRLCTMHRQAAATLVAIGVVLAVVGCSASHLTASSDEAAASADHASTPSAAVSTPAAPRKPAPADVAAWCAQLSEDAGIPELASSLTTEPPSSTTMSGTGIRRTDGHGALCIGYDFSISVIDLTTSTAAESERQAEGGDLNTRYGASKTQPATVDGKPGDLLYQYANSVGTAVFVTSVGNRVVNIGYEIGRAHV